MTAAANPPGKPRIRPAESKDFEQICALMRRELNDAFSVQQWMQLFSHHWSGSPHYGYLMETDVGQIVGFMGAILAERVIDGRQRIVCNLTSWCVEQAYRGEGGLMLLMPYLRKSDWIVTTLTPAPVVVEIFEKVGFRYYDQERLILPALWNLGLSMLAPLRMTRGEKLVTALTPEENKLLADHLPHGCKGYLFQSGERRLFLITRRRRMRGIPLSEILHSSDPGLLAARLERIKLALMVNEGSLGLLCDGRFIARGIRLAVRIRRTAMLRARDYDGHSLDNLYTERVLLPV
jgi:hypothetical protein